MLKFSPFAIISPYQYVANNPVKNIDAKGDSIFVTANLKGDHRIWDSFRVLERTALGRKEVIKFQRSTTNDIYISSESGRDETVEYTYSHAGARLWRVNYKVKFCFFKGAK